MVTALLEYLDLLAVFPIAYVDLILFVTILVEYLLLLRHPLFHFSPIFPEFCSLLLASYFSKKFAGKIGTALSLGYLEGLNWTVWLYRLTCYEAMTGTSAILSFSALLLNLIVCDPCVAWCKISRQSRWHLLWSDRSKYSRATDHYKRYVKDLCVSSLKISLQGRFFLNDLRKSWRDHGNSLAMCSNILLIMGFK